MEQGLYTIFVKQSSIMSNTSVFDTLACAKKLKSAGFTEGQAEAQAEVLAGIIDEKLATKQDIRDLKRDILDLKRDMKELEMRMLIRLGAIQAAGIAIVAAPVKLL